MARLGELRSSVTNKVKHAIHSGPFSPSKRTAAAEPPKDRNDPHGRDMHAGPTILTADKIGEVLKSNKELNALLDGIERERIKLFGSIPHDAAREFAHKRRSSSRSPP